MHSLLVLDAWGTPTSSTTYTREPDGPLVGGSDILYYLGHGIGGVRPVAVMDREADIFTLFRKQQDQGTAYRCVPNTTGRWVRPSLGSRRPARKTRLGLHWRILSVPPPRKSADYHADSMALHEQTVQESSPPLEVKPLVWHLLTTVPVTCAENAV